MHVNVLAASRRQEDKARTQAFASNTAKRGCREAMIRAALPRYEKSLAEYYAWFAAYGTAVVEVAKLTEALVKLASADGGRCRESTDALQRWRKRRWRSTMPRRRRLGMPKQWEPAALRRWLQLSPPMTKRRPAACGTLPLWPRWCLL